MSASKRKGTSAESAVVAYLQEHGWPHAERRALSGSKDKGDVTGVPFLCFEVKSGARIDLPGWLRELAAEKTNAAAAHAALVIKPRGVGATRVGDWYAAMPVSDLLALLHAAGYGDTPDHTHQETA